MHHETSRGFSADQLGNAYVLIPTPERYQKRLQIGPCRTGSQGLQTGQRANVNRRSASRLPLTSIKRKVLVRPAHLVDSFQFRMPCVGAAGGHPSNIVPGFHGRA